MEKTIDIIQSMEQKHLSDYKKTIEIEQARGVYTHQEASHLYNFLEQVKKQGLRETLPLIESTDLHLLSRFARSILRTYVRLLEEETNAREFFIYAQAQGLSQDSEGKVIGRVKAASKAKALKSLFIESNERHHIPLIDNRRGSVVLGNRTLYAKLVNS